MFRVIPQGIQGLEIGAAVVMRAVEAVGDNGHGLLFARICRLAKHAVNAACTALNPQRILRDGLRKLAGAAATFFDNLSGGWYSQKGHQEYNKALFHALCVG